MLTLNLNHERFESKRQCNCERVRARPRATLTTKSDLHRCVSCGQRMDRVLYFTICPHCGFNYRIEVNPIEEKTQVGARSLLYLLSTIVLIVSALVLLLIA